MTALTFLPLPIEADEGFPQAFRLAMDNNNLYTVAFYLNAPEAEVLALPQDGFFDVPSPLSHSFLVMRVAREGAAGEQLIFQRKLVLNLEYTAAELAFRFSRIHIARANLNSPGAFGSQVQGEVASRWAS
jgi:hypothetical protein